MDLVADLNNEDSKRKKFQVFKNVSADFRAIAAISEIQGCLYGSKVLSFGHSNLQRKPHFRNKKYNWGTSPSVREVFLNLATYQEIGVKPHYCIITIGLQGYFKGIILSFS